MLSSTIKSVILPVAIIAAGFAAIFGLSGILERERAPLPTGYEDSDLMMNGSRLKGFCLGMECLVADWYWMRSLQYIGNKLVNAKDEAINIDDLRALNPRLLYPYLDNATDLDPHFTAVYNYGAIVLPAIDPNKAIIIAQKGITNNPGEWRLYQHLGYIYWKLKRYDDAAATFDRGAEIPGAGAFMRLMAASMRTEGGSRSTARKIYQQMLAGTDDDMVKVTAERRLEELDSLEERDVLDKLLGQFRQNNGRCVTNLNELLPMLRSVHLPEGRDFLVNDKVDLIDPTGAPYLLDGENCRVKPDPRLSGLPAQ